MLEYCTGCGAVLSEQYGFDPNIECWQCTICDQYLINPDSTRIKRFPDIVWVCDNCGSILNNQCGFDDFVSYWVCDECGHTNAISEDDIDGKKGVHKDTKPDYSNDEAVRILSDLIVVLLSSKQRKRQKQRDNIRQQAAEGFYKSYYRADDSNTQGEYYDSNYRAYTDDNVIHVKYENLDESEVDSPYKKDRRCRFIRRVVSICVFIISVKHNWVSLGWGIACSFSLLPGWYGNSKIKFFQIALPLFFGVMAIMEG